MRSQSRSSPVTILRWCEVLVYSRGSKRQRQSLTAKRVRCYACPSRHLVTQQGVMMVRSISVQFRCVTPNPSCFPHKSGTPSPLWLQTGGFRSVRVIFHAVAGMMETGGYRNVTNPVLRSRGQIGQFASGALVLVRFRLALAMAVPKSKSSRGLSDRRAPG